MASSAVPPPNAIPDVLDCDSSSNEDVPKVVSSPAIKQHHRPSGMSSVASPETQETHNNMFLMSDDESGNLMDRDYTGMFEGPEKTLEVVFRRLSDDRTDFSMGEIRPATAQRRLPS